VTVRSRPTRSAGPTGLAGLAGRIYDAIERHERLVLAIVGLVVLLSGVAATGVEIDSSFRPFFADSDREARLTEEFEARFGQPSGAYMVAIIEDEDVLSPEPLREVRDLGDRVADIPHVSQVLSLATMPSVGIGPDGLPTSDHLIAEELYREGAPPLPADLVDRLESDPWVEGNLLARDGRSTLLLARVDLPLSDLDGRRPVIDAFEDLVRSGAPTGSTIRITGVSVVEAEFADIVLRQLLGSVAVLSTVLLVVLYVHFRRLGAVLAVMTPVWLAMPITLAVMALAGIAITAVSSQVLTIVLIVGVAQGIRLQEQLYRGREADLPLAASARTGFVRLAVPGAATAVTTAIGFFALLSAGIAVIREFAVAAGAGVVAVYVLANLVVPIIQRRLRPDRHAGLRGQAAVTRLVLGAVEAATTRRPSVVFAGALGALTVLAVVGLPRLDLDQKFNGELPAGHEIRANQAMLEEQYSGFLGPELWLRPGGDTTLVDETALASLGEFVEDVRALPEVLRVTAVTDFLPPGMSGPDAERFLSGLRDDPRIAPLVDEVATPNLAEGAVVVRTTDMGSDRAGSFVADLEQLAERSFGDEVRVDVVGQWWMAQRGMRGLLSDMLGSMTTAAALILMFLMVTLRSLRFFMLSLVPAVAPVVGAIAVMGALDIQLRIGTAMILAVALGLVVDDTIYYLSRLKAEDDLGRSPVAAVRQMFGHEARAGLLSSLVLIAGFATMTVNELSAIRDMGIVAVLTMAIAVASDLIFDPSQFLLTARWRRQRRAEEEDARDEGVAVEPAELEPVREATAR
jgi:predicted RND superfamily exporter protein